MFDTADQQVRIARWAWLTSLATLVIGQLHALARFQTEDGKSDLDLPLTGAWAEPATDFFEPLLDWAGPDTVYLTYGKWWTVALGVMVAAAIVVARLRQPYGAEKWGWRLFIAGYSLLTLGVTAYYWGQWTAYNVLEDIGLWAQLPAALVGTIGATVLGVALLRRGARPRVAAVLLLLSFVWVFTISQVTSLGNTDLPIMFAIALLAREATAPTSVMVDRTAVATTQ